MRYLISTYLLTLVLSGMSLANDFAANDLLQMLNQDPSLLLDPENTVEAPPPVLPLPYAAREPQSEKEERSIPMEVAEGPEPKEIKVEPPVEMAKEIKVEPPVEMVKETPVQVQHLPEPHVLSQLVALPGANDFSIILSEKEFFPAMIKMKQSEKARLLFISTSSKPGALVFTKPQIQRWMEREPASTSLQITNEIHSTKVTQIEFSAEPGTYKFYDALSGASGEIQVE